MPRLQALQRAGQGIDDDGQFVVKVVGGGGRDRARPIGFRNSFHARKSIWLATRQAFEKLLTSLFSAQNIFGLDVTGFAPRAHSANIFQRNVSLEIHEIPGS
jgi:hypothetical protein